MLVPKANRANMLANILTSHVGSNVGQHVGTGCQSLRTLEFNYILPSYHCSLSYIIGQKQSPEPVTLFKKETMEQVFSCKFCEISENASSDKTPPLATSERVV